MKLLKAIIDRIFNYIGKKAYSSKIKAKRVKLEQRGLLSVGRRTYGLENIEFFWYKGSESKVSIGSFCSIAPNVSIILGGMHPVDWVALYPIRTKYQLPGAYNDGMPSTKGDIVLGNDVWVGTNVTIMSGVKIGNGAVIASNSVVTKDVPAFSIYAGVPAKFIRLRFSEDQIDALNEIAWWEWSDDKITESVSLLSSPSIDEFIQLNNDY